MTGGLSEVVSRAGRRSLALDWRGWFALGILAGGMLLALIAGGPSFHGYGWLTDALRGDARILVAPILLAAACSSGTGPRPPAAAQVTLVIEALV